MLGEWAYATALWKLKRAKRKVEREMWREISKGFNRQGDALREIDDLQDEILMLQHRYWMDKADEYLLPRPEFQMDDVNWTTSKYKRVHLTREALAKLRTEVRAEMKGRWERWQGRLTLTIGLIGTLIGLIALLKK